MELPNKRDERPPKGGWSPGHYVSKCMTCKIEMMASPISLVCADCAYGTKPKEKQNEN